MPMPVVTVQQALAILRARYPLALICTLCALLLATQPASYAKSNLTEEARLSYVCAGCRLDLAEAERVKAIRAEVGRRTIGRARAARAAGSGIETSRDGAPVLPYASRSEAPSRTRINSGNSARVSITRATRAGARRGGRPRRHASDAIARREASRAYRARRRAIAVSSA